MESRKLKKTADNKLNKKVVVLMVAITLILNLSICGFLFYRNTTQFQITFYGNHLDDDGQLVFDPFSISITAYADTDISEQLSSINFTKSGHKFVGWFTDKKFKHEYVLKDTMPGRNLNLYGKWEIQSYNVTYDFQLGDNVANITQENITYNTTIADKSYSLPQINNADIPAGYTFIKWTTDKSGLSTYSFTENSVVKTNTTVYAIWGYRVDYNYGDEDVANAPQYSVVVRNTTFAQNNTALPAPSVEGKTFVGWFTEANGNGTMITNTTKITNAMTLYACFENTTI